MIFIIIQFGELLLCISLRIINLISALRFFNPLLGICKLDETLFPVLDKLLHDVVKNKLILEYFTWF